MAREYLVRKQVVEPQPRELVNIVECLVSKSAFRDTLNLNAPPRPGALNIYFVNPVGQTAIRGNCTYAGNGFIFCDSAFVTTMRDLISSSDLSDELESDYALILGTWIIAHELAHAELEHDTSHFYGRNRPETEEEAWITQSLEAQADDRSLAFIDVDELNILEAALITAFNASHERTYGQVNDPLGNLHFIRELGFIYPYKLQRTHPHMTIRTAIMLAIAAPTKDVREEAEEFLLAAQLHLVREFLNDRVGEK